MLRESSDYLYPFQLILPYEATGFSHDMYLQSNIDEIRFSFGEFVCDFHLHVEQDADERSPARFLAAAADRESCSPFALDLELTKIEIMGAIMALLYHATFPGILQARNLLSLVLDLEGLKWGDITERARDYTIAACWKVPDELQTNRSFWREEAVKLGQRFITSEPMQRLRSIPRNTLNIILKYTA